MTYSVYQHWDPLKVCVVGRSYPPEFYSWIKISHVRKLFERIATETEEDYQNIIKKLESFGVTVLRPTIPDNSFIDGKYLPPPMTPRDYTVMISRIGQDLYFGTKSYDQDTTKFKQMITQEFPNTRNHIVNTGGHSDATYCPVCPGLIISLNDVPTYADTFPGWEVVYLPGQSWSKVSPFLDLKEKNKGKWWIPGFEHDQDVINIIETWLGHWTGYVEETVFDVNMLIIDPKNVMVFGYNKQVFDALDQYGITPHVVPFRHRYFWDGGIHCVTSDLHREGAMQDYFPERPNVR